MMNQIVGLIFVVMGVFQSIAIIKKWPWAINFYRVRFFYRHLGDRGAEIFLHFFNLCIVLLGLYIALGTIE